MRPTFEEIINTIRNPNFYDDPNQNFEFERFIAYQQKLDNASAESEKNSVKSKFNYFGNEITTNDKDVSECKNNKNWFIDEEDEKYHVFVEIIKENQFYILKKVIDIRNKQVMCKKILIPEDNDFKHLKNVMKKFEFFPFIDHPCICKIYGVNTNEILNNESQNDEAVITTVALFLEYLDFDLKDCLAKGMLTNTIKAQISIEVAHGMLHIHNKDLIHRDLRIDNIRLNSILESKIVDLGLAKITEAILSKYSTSQTSFINNLSSHIYMSPELLNEDEYDQKNKRFFIWNFVVSHVQ